MYTRCSFYQLTKLHINPVEKRVDADIWIKGYKEKMDSKSPISDCKFQEKKKAYLNAQRTVGMRFLVTKNQIRIPVSAEKSVAAVNYFETLETAEKIEVKQTIHCSNL